MVKWQGIVLHHSASSRGFWQGDKLIPVNSSVIRDWHVKEIFYNYLNSGLQELF